MLNVSHIVNSVFTSRTYIIRADGSQEFWLVDCGDVPPLLERLSAMSADGFSVKGVLLTHAHYDHIYGLPRLRTLFPELRVFTNVAGREALGDERRNMSKYHGDPIHYGGDNVVVCSEGTEIALFEGFSAKVYETPGHNPSCLCFELGDYLFTGDAYIPGVKVVTTLPGADKSLAAASWARIHFLAQGKVLCPGHELKEEQML